MEVKVIEREENPLMDREELRFEVEHKNAPTPSRAEVLEKLSAELEMSEELIVIEKVATPHGHQIASGIARVYESEDRLRELEPEYLMKRTEVSGEKPEEEVEKEEEPEKEEVETEEKPEEETSEEKEEEEAPEKDEEKGETEEGEEEVETGEAPEKEEEGETSEEESKEE